MLLRNVGESDTLFAMTSITEIAKNARRAGRRLATLDAATKNAALARIGEELNAHASEVFSANERDLERAEESGLAAPLKKRLAVNDDKLTEIIRGVDALRALPDPVGRVLEARELDTGLELYRKSAPIGVIGVVFESRPDALVQISTLCLKSGNAVILKGGSEAAESNRVLARIIASASLAAGLPDGWISLLETREDVGLMLREDEYIDLIVPRGSNEFVRHVMNSTQIPVLGHADGVCHVYVDADAEMTCALDIVDDSKTQYVAVCNAAETILVHREIADDFLPALAERFAGRVKILGCPETRRILPAVDAASDDDWSAEYLDYLVAVRVVDDVIAAVEHINMYGSGHTDAIVTTDRARAEWFMTAVDSASVFHNCSTRFADGYRYGLGAELGIATGKIHARGPVGLDGLLSYKWQMYGAGHVVSDYTGAAARPFTHRALDAREQ